MRNGRNSFLGSIPTKDLHSFDMNIRPNSCGINYFPLFLLKLHKGYGISEFSACRLQLLVVVFFLNVKIDEEVKMC